MSVMLKICGITRVEDAIFCTDAGADFVGIVFVPTSGRFVTGQQAREIAASLRGSSTKLVGVFQNQPYHTVRRIAQDVGLDFVQLHGDESEAEIAAIGFPVIKAIRAGERESARAEWLLYDATRGGSGKAFDWSLVPNTRTKPIFLAGGINAANVTEAIRTVNPDAIDVSTGVEDAPGIKNCEKIAQLLERIRNS